MTDHTMIPRDILDMLRARRALSDALPAYTLRDDARVARLQAVDMTIERAAAAAGLSAASLWRAYNATGGFADDRST